MSIRPMGMILGFLIIASAVGYLHVAADEWRPSPNQYWSANHSYHLDVKWNWKPNRHLVLTLKRTTQNGSSVVWTASSPQELPPLTVYITEDGRHVVLRDQWGSVGYGKVIAILGPKGQVLSSYSLDELITQEERLNAFHTISSLHWSASGLFFFRQASTKFCFITQKGTVRLFDLATGKRLPVSVSLRAIILSEQRPGARAALSSQDADIRSEAIKHVAMLEDQSAIPLLTHLLDDPTAQADTVRQNPDIPDGTYQYFPVQWEAGKALIHLSGQESLPLLIRKFTSANPYMQDWWLPLIIQAGGPRAHSFLNQLTAAKRPSIRRQAIVALLEADDIEYLRSHRELLFGRNASIRYSAIVLLSRHATSGEAGLLHRALKDPDDINALWALRGLIRLHPPDLTTLLQHYCRQGKGWIAQEAQLALAEQGDSTELKHLVSWVGNLRFHTHNRVGWGTEEMDAEDVCRILAKRHPPGAEAALRQARRNFCPRIQLPANGALATFGNAEARTRLREFAQKGEALDRASAIRWLGTCRDQEAEALLKTALSDEEPWVREAAREALQQLSAASSPAVSPRLHSR